MFTAAKKNMPEAMWGGKGTSIHISNGNNPSIVIGASDSTMNRCLDIGTVECTNAAINLGATQRSTVAPLGTQNA